jgi:DNA replication factor GINS
MDIEEILAIWESCKEGKFQKIPEDFYERIDEMIKEREKKKSEVDEVEYLKIEDEIRTLKRIRNDVFEVRMGKILKLAWAKVCGRNVELDCMIGIEKDLFDKIVELLEKFKSAILGKLKKEEKVEYVLVRIKKDIPEFEGVDGRIYRLKKEDIVLLPQLNAKALIESGVAEIVEFKR